MRESETRYKTLFNSLDTGFCVFEMLYNDQGEPIDYLFPETNPEFAQHTGLHDAIGKSARMLVPGLEQYWVDYYGDVADTGISKVFDEESPTMGRCGRRTRERGMTRQIAREGRGDKTRTLVRPPVFQENPANACLIGLRVPNEVWAATGSYLDSAKIDSAIACQRITFMNGLYKTVFQRHAINGILQLQY